MQFKELQRRLNEKKSDYPIYHRQYSDAISAALDYAKAQGYEVDMDDVWQHISTGPRKPSEGKTNRFSLDVTKNGKPVRKSLQIQVYGMGDKYELNTYIA